MKKEDLIETIQAALSFNSDESRDENGKWTSGSFAKKVSTDSIDANNLSLKRPLREAAGEDRNSLLKEAADKHNLVADDLDKIANHLPNSHWRKQHSIELSAHHRDWANKETSRIK